MQSVNIITVGKLKEKYLKDAVNEYCKRLNAFCKINVVELSEQRLSDNPSDKEIKNALSLEGKTMLSYIDKPMAYNFIMCIEGKQMPSEKLAQSINEISVSGKSIINFVIGSSFGIADEIKAKADFKLSMSQMTFPHQLARVMLLEQVYRAFAINNHSKYHK